VIGTETASAVPAPSAKAPPRPCYLQSADCLTGFGNAVETVQHLLAGEVALQPAPVLSCDGGDLVPLALRAPFTHSAPPRWWQDLLTFLAPLKGGLWGQPDHPILFASSNYGIDGLYSLGQQRLLKFAPLSTPHGCAAALSAELGWGETSFLFSHACVSGQLALDRAAALIAAGQAKQALVVTFDYVGPFVAGGFHALKILNDQFPAPYADAEIGSIGLGDGAAWCVLSAVESPFRLGRQNTFNEMFHFTANEPTGSGFRAVLAPYTELAEAHRFWIKGHGTGTLEAGKLESTLLAERFPSAPLVSWKGSLGHTLGSCAAVELVIAVEAIKQGLIPGTVGSRPPFFAPNVQVSAFSAKSFDSVLLLSNAFGGAHASLLLHYA